MGKQIPTANIGNKGKRNKSQQKVQAKVVTTGETSLPQGDFLTFNFKCLVRMRTSHLPVDSCFLPTAIKDADAADGIIELGNGMLKRVGIKRDISERSRAKMGGRRQNAPFSTSSLLREVKVLRMRW
jgi:hypothetical protein